MSAQLKMGWGAPPAGIEQPWIVTFKDGTTRRIPATSRDGALRSAHGSTGLRGSVVSCEPATLSMFTGCGQ